MSTFPEPPQTRRARQRAEILRHRLACIRLRKQLRKREQDLANAITAYHATP